MPRFFPTHSSLPSDFFDATPSTSVGGLQNLGRYGEPDTNDNENSTGIDTNVSSNGSKPQVEGLPAGERFLMFSEKLGGLGGQFPPLEKKSLNIYIF